MCHELGHSFGLAHTDEDFYNEDLKNCMDYTLNYSASKHPDESNFETLADYYGVVGERRRRRQLLRQKQEQEEQQKQQWRNNNNKIPQEVKDRRNEAIQNLDKLHYRDIHQQEGWRMLHSTKYAEEYELDLGQGYKLSVHMLLA